MAGDTLTAGTGAVIINGSYVQGSFNRTLSHDSADIEKAIRAVSQKVQASGDESARFIFGQFTQEVQKPKSDPKTLKGYWDTVVKLVPDVAKLTESVAKIATLFS